MPYLPLPLNIIPQECLRCGACVSLCQTNALTLTFDGISCQADRCTLCYDCVIFCPVEAIREPYVS